MNLPEYKYIPVHEYSNNSKRPAEIAISTEYPVFVTLNGHPFVTIACSGNNMEELLTGHLVAEGLIEETRDIKNIDLDSNEMIAAVTVTPTEQVRQALSRIPSLVTCGKGSKRDLPSADYVYQSLPDVRAEVIRNAMNTFLSQSSLHEKTHGVHSSALVDINGKQEAFFDEIGRHNAIDKVIGYAFNKNIALDDKMILSTGRISSEIIMKSIYARVPVLVSRASPTTYCVDLIKRYNILCICKARNNSFIIINGENHVHT
ncbi:MAG: formate dehydrogenase accessory sulfurtransferase FdhD [Spirochaetota bacterium]